MEKYLFLWKKWQTGIVQSSGLLFVILFAASCAQGFEGNEMFTSTVTNVQLESPGADKVKISVVLNAKGEEEFKFEWPVIYGAGGYLFSFYIVDDPYNPIAVGEENQVLDKCSTQRAKHEDTKYKIVIKTLGSERYNNKEAIAATEISHSTLVPKIAEIPDGADLAEYFANHPIQSIETEQAYELVAGGNYTLNGILDFGLHWITLRGNKINRATVNLGSEGGLVTQAGLTLKFINFDCSAATTKGIVSLSTIPDESIKCISVNNEKQYIYYLIHNPIIMQACSFGGVTNGIFYGNGKDYAVKDFWVSDCVIQLNNDNVNSVINLSEGKGAIKDLKIVNSTFYNLLANSVGFFAKYSSASNADPKKFGFNDETGSIYLKNNTFHKVMTGKHFGNGLSDTPKVTITIQNNIFFDCNNINKAVGSSTQTDIKNNYLFTITIPLADSDKKYGIEEDPLFTGPVDTAPDQVNFKPRSVQTASAKAGDPRWYK